MYFEINQFICRNGKKTEPETLLHLILYAFGDGTMGCDEAKYYSLSHKTVNTRENFWNVYCFATNQMRDETAKDNRQTSAWISHWLFLQRTGFSSTANLQKPNYRIWN